MKKKKLVKKIVRNIVILIVTPILIIGLLFLFRNTIGEKLIEGAGSKIVGAQVNVDGLNINPFSLGFSWERLQVTNPNNTMYNAVETGSCVLDVQIMPLLSKKVIIDSMTTDNLRFNTKRESDGSIPKEESTDDKSSKKQEKKEKGFIEKELEKQKSQIPIFDPAFFNQEIDVDQIMEDLDFSTPKKVQEVKDQANEKFEYWNNKLENNQYESKLNSINRDLNSINPAKIGSVADLQKGIVKVDSILKTGNEIKKDFTKDKQDFNADIKYVKSLKKDVPVWIKDDYKNALSKASLGSLNLEEIGSALFGEKLTDLLLKATDSILKARSANKDLEKKAKEEEKVKKDKYPHLPTIWIKETALNIVTEDNISLTGSCTNISSDHKKSGNPMVINLTAIGSKYGDLEISSTFDYTTDQSKEKLSIDAHTIPIPDFEITDSKLLPNRVKKGDAKAEILIEMIEEDLIAEVIFVGDNLEFDYNSLPKDDSRLSGAVRTITSGIDNITVNGTYKTVDKKTSFDLDSNLDEVISREIKELQGEEVRKAQKELKKRVDKELNKYKNELDNYILKEEKKLASRFNLVDGQLLSQNAGVNSKKAELEKAIQDKISSQAEDKVKDSVDKVLGGIGF